MKKKVLIFLACVGLFTGLLREAIHAQQITPAQQTAVSPITYGISTVNDANSINGVKYVVKDVTITDSVVGYSSVSLVVPENYTPNYTLPTGWSLHVSGSILNFIITTPLTNGSVARVKDFLENNFYLTLTNADTFSNAVETLSINVSETLISSRVDENGVTHYYEFVPATSISWAAAYNGARARTLNGLQGYLATITSAEEQQFIYTSIAKTGGWLGATRMRYANTYDRINDETTIPTAIGSFNIGINIANDWYWATGPESGTVFFDGPTAATGTTVAGQYSNWNTNQPDNSNNEFVMQFAFGGADRWNDLPFTQSTYAKGYYVEYGGYPGEQPSQDSAGYQVNIPKPVKTEFLSVSNDVLYSSEFIFGNEGEAYQVADPKVAPTGYQYLGLDTNSAPVSGTYSDVVQTVIYRYAKIYEVDFNLNYLTSIQPPITQQVAETLLVGKVTNPTREGFTFTGWNTASDGSGTTWNFDTMKMPANDMTLYATWSINSYKASFDTMGGNEVIPTQTKEYDSTLDVVSNPTKEGYTFTGWNTASDGSGQAWDFTTMKMPANDMTLYATWSINSYKASFDTMGGNEVIPTQTKEYDSTLDVVSNPTKEGYTFTGWNTASDGSGQAWDFTTMKMPANDMTLYATWSINSYKASFDTMGGNEVIPTQTKEYDSTLDVVSNPTKKGYTFTGWNTASDGSGQAWDFTTMKMPANDITLYAQWSKNTYMIRFDANQGKGMMNNQSFEYEQNQALLKNTYTRDRYTFSGWSTSMNGDVAYKDLDNYTFLETDNIVLYAVWKKDEVKPNVIPPKPDDKKEAPATGDSTNITLMFSLLMVSGFILIGLRRREEK